MKLLFVCNIHKKTFSYNILVFKYKSYAEFRLVYNQFEMHNNLRL